MGLKKYIILTFVSIICLGCSSRKAFRANDFFYDYDFDLFEDFEVEKDSENKKAVNLHYVCSFIKEEDKVSTSIDAYLGQPLMPFLIPEPDLNGKNGIPFHYLTGIYEDSECKHLIELERISNLDSNLNNLYFEIKTFEEIEKFDIAPNLFSGKYINGKDMEMEINYPYLTFSYKNHSLNVEITSDGSPLTKTLKIDGDKIDTSKYNYVYSIQFGLVCGGIPKEPKNTICNYYMAYFLELFFDYINEKIDAEDYINYIEFRTLFKGVDYSSLMK